MVSKLHLLPQSEHARATSLQFSWTPLTPLINVRVAKKTIAPSWPIFVLPFAGSSDFVTPGVSTGVISTSNVPKQTIGGLDWWTGLVD